MKLKSLFLLLSLIFSNLGYGTPLDTYLGEKFEGGSSREENRLISKLAKMSIRSLEQRYPVGSKKTVPRDVHGKSHGCLFGHIETKNKALPYELRTGIFKNNDQYKVVLRYSSNDKKKNFKDVREDIRGLGLKVMNVGNEIGRSQDFLFLASEAFFIKDNAFYVKFLQVLFDSSKTWSGLWLAMNDPKGAWSVGKDMLRTSLRYENPLQIPFFSAVPYRLGAKLNENGSENFSRRAVKYRIKETSCERVSTFEWLKKVGRRTYESLPVNKLFFPNYLRQNLRNAMNKADACLTLSVQIRDQKDKNKYPVEDSSIPWDIDYVEVGDIKLHSQSFDFPKMNSFCEKLKFSPWHTLPEHQPLGRINRARLKIYEAISNYRHERNGVKDYHEPTDFSMELSK